MTASAIGTRHRWPVWLRLVTFGIVVAAMIGLTVAVVRWSATRPIVESPAAAPLTGPARLVDLAGDPGEPGPGGDPNRRTLVLYRETGPAAQASRQYAIQAANLASRGGAWQLRPIEQYQPGELESYQAMIHVATGGEPVPPHLLTDIADSAVPVLWMGFGIEQLFASDPSLVRRLGWSVDGQAEGELTGVEYNGRLLKRRAEDNANVTRIAVGAA